MAVEELYSNGFQGGGIHGNAILSKYDIEFRVIDHQYHGFDWDNNGDRLREPRKGYCYMFFLSSLRTHYLRDRRRYSLAATVRAPELPPVLCYCLHLEVCLLLHITKN